MFQFPGLAHMRSGMTLIRFPHSDIAGSKDVCSSPTLIAAYHVLHRLLVPRHPPNALSSLIKILLELCIAVECQPLPKTSGFESLSSV